MVRSGAVTHWSRWPNSGHRELVSSLYSSEDTAENQETSLELNTSFVFLTTLHINLKYQLLRVIFVIAIYNSFRKISFSCERLIYIVLSLRGLSYYEKCRLKRLLLNAKSIMLMSRFITLFVTDIWVDVSFKTFLNANVILHLLHLKTSIIRLNYMDNHVWKEAQGFEKKDRFYLTVILAKNTLIDCYWLIRCNLETIPELYSI